MKGGDPVKSQDILEKYDRESHQRLHLGKWTGILSFLAISLTLFHLYTGWYGAFPSRIQGPIHLGIGLGLVFLLFPLKKGWHKKQKHIPWYDGVLAFLALAVGFYNVIFYESLITDRLIFGYNTWDYITSTLGVLLVLEAARRCVGIPIVLVCSAAMLYALFGNLIPGKMFAHQGFSWGQLTTELYLTTKGIYSTPIQISSTFIYLFLFFGVMLIKTGIGRFFNDIAFALAGRFTGGQSKAAVTASGLQGMISGSSVANTVGSGAFTIPMMKKAGYRPAFAAATEASASTGGQIMPPIMGAAAFIMVSYTKIPYSEIILAATVPALLYFSGIFLGTHFESKRLGITGMPVAQLPRFKELLLKRGYLLLPLIVIFYTLLSGKTPMRAALLAIAASFIVSLIRKETRMSLRSIVDALEQGARTALPVITACAAAGIIVGVVVQTGLGTRIANGIITLGAGLLLPTLMFTMVACIVLGMGLPTTANYVVTATMAAPALILGLDVPVLAAHMFVFYFGIVADITPPVCLAAYAGAGLAGANPFRAGLNAVKLAAGAYIIPYMFVINPQLLFIDFQPLTLMLAVMTALLGMAAISGSLTGYFLQTTRTWERLLLFFGGLLLMTPGIYADMAGGLFIGAVVINQIRHRNRSSLTDIRA